MYENLSDIDKGYIAGLIDGEGHITLKQDPSTKRNKWNLAVYLRLTMTDSDVLQWCKQIFGGYTGKNGVPKNPNWNQSYYWVLTAAKARELIRIIFPYLKVKQNQAKCILEYTETLNLSTNTGIKPDIIKKRLAIKTEIDSWNKRGVAKRERQLEYQTISEPIINYNYN